MSGTDIFFLRLSCRFLAESLQPSLINQAIRSLIRERLRLRELARNVASETRGAHGVSASDQMGWHQEG